MKKVLVLTVIAVLALGVMALAGTDEISATCSTGYATVTSTIGIEQGIEALATSYNASFCGATGGLYGTLNTSLNAGVTGEGDYAMIASIGIKSNAATVTVTITKKWVDASGSALTDQTTMNNHFDFGYYFKGTSAIETTNSKDVVLSSGSTYYGGENEVDAALLIKSNGSWNMGLEAGDYYLKVSFEVQPTEDNF